MNSELIVVSNRLPYYQNKKKIWKRAAGGLINAVEPIVIESKGTWIGWDGNDSKQLTQYQVNQLSCETRQLPDSYKINCVPLTKEEASIYYDHFCNETLWALFHYFFEKCSINEESWKMYKIINERFAEIISQTAAKGASVWIHDYHLMLVPRYLKLLRPELDMHFFLHTPFPHIDIYSILPWGREILHSLLQCSSVGFHHESYLSNFLGAAKRLNVETNNCQTFTNPISIDFELFDTASRSNIVQTKQSAFKESMGSIQILLSIDRIDYSKGIKERLLAIESLLKSRPDLIEKFVYYQLTIPSRENVGSYQELKKEVDELVGRINGSYATEKWAPIHYHYGTKSFEQLTAIYLASDICLVTPLRDGMNLVCKEFIAAHSDEKGVLILSQFAGAISEINDCLAANPYSINNLKLAIETALEMPEPERTDRMKNMRSSISKHNIHHWWEICRKYFKLYPRIGILK
ncbi:trehalose-phosphate synthase [Waddlia chondrophila 2032/99]|uniref:Trehalose-phosphate synthase n=1 Tax=Waddlia chondrophila 2032/99 TaxID=765953 RepID=F8LCZ9_9BACT|nr:trehalose-phosphate synthase [Waddlia chondrophila 2032/99]